ncbi:MAG: ribosomal subunit interface protein [Thermobacillus sp. ZCTH02-B1]|uniref:ribosome hibernation-promoting factor, HPF/YfiA family n=1 Tax=Thermobacillus sp. ZCTH02-B1 TaxID=1858795 RepID=UPI000B55B6CC|nr:ribosome-associated translation inhibitor RaiA [Thermobacillus sp. ZCTH02-B1]OUM94980.1 MAG: ribosomal subunit interface protein [Thermobacillus sp. ZCTH02-B1]
MRLNIRGKQLPVTEALKEYAEKKLARLDKYFENPQNLDAQVTLSVTKNVHVVEVTISLPGLLLRAEERHDDMYAAIDLVVDKLERQIRKHKTRVNRKLRQEGRLKELFAEEPAGKVAVAEADEEEKFEVVRTKRHTLKPMDVDEAILQMNLLGHSFFVFINADTKEVNVVYRRQDGKYGLIEQA